MTSRPDRFVRGRWALHRLMPYMLLMLCSVLTLIASEYISSVDQERIHAAFLTSAKETIREIDFRLNMYVEAIRAAATLLEASNEVSHTEFRAFVEELHVDERYPGIVGIGYAEYVPQAAMRSFQRAMTLESLPIRLWPPGERDSYTPVIFLEPQRGNNQSSLGFDIQSDVKLSATLDTARDSAQPVASPKLNSLYPFAAVYQSGLVLIVPVYRAGVRPLTVNERRLACVGFVFCPLNSAEIVRQVAAGSPSSIRFEIYDGTKIEPAALVGLTEPVPKQLDTLIVPVKAGGRTWTVVAGTRDDVPDDPGLSSRARDTLVGGFALSLLLFMITRTQIRAWMTVAQHESDLRASGEALAENESKLRRLHGLEREARQQAQAADRAKEEFLSTVSHELRTPLNAILGWVTLLKGGNMDAPKQARAFDVIERNARQQAKLIDELLDVSRIVSGKIRLSLEIFDLGVLAGEVAESLRPIAADKRVTIECHFAGQAMVRADRDRLQQVVWNLLSNAIKFSQQDGRIDLTLTSRDHQAELAVTDTGIGISADLLPHVFDRFRQGDSSFTRSHGGLGLGLAIVKQLVELHGGSIHAMSEGLGHGSQFVVRLPLTSIGPSDADANAQASAPRLDGVRVLVVDDDANAREIVTASLERAGARVTAVPSGRDAVAHLKSAGADVLVSDIAMPEQDGLSLIREIRGLPGDGRAIPAIALTAYASDLDRERAIESGYQAFLPKPVQLIDLQAQVRKLIDAV
jgi:signal transduction histidine kinase/CheY-like chemotaxis protein